MDLEQYNSPGITMTGKEDENDETTMENLRIFNWNYYNIHHLAMDWL